MSRRRKTKNGQRQKSTKTIHINIRSKVSPLEQSLPRVSF